MKEKARLGSGKLYIDEFTGALPEDDTIEVEEKLLGLIQSGAAITYSPEFTEITDDLGLYYEEVLTKEEVILKSGVLTWNGNTLRKLCSTARVTEDAENKIRTVKMGGIPNREGKKYIIRFVHEDKEKGDVRVTIVGSNKAGFELAFAMDKPTVINVEFKARPLDSDGTLVIYEEKDSSITA